MPSKYSRYQPERTQLTSEEKRRIHPIWRGVGCAMLILFPLIAYAAMDILLKQSWFPLPVDMFAKRTDFIWGMFPDQLAYIKIATFLVILILLFAIFTLVSFLINSVFGVSERKDPYYVPPVRRQRRRRV
jgi:hypothetical protein